MARVRDYGHDCAVLGEDDNQLTSRFKDSARNPASLKAFTLISRYSLGDRSSPDMMLLVGLCENEGECFGADPALPDPRQRVMRKADFIRLIALHLTRSFSVWVSHLAGLKPLVFLYK